MERHDVKTYWARIYVAGELGEIESTCREACMSGLCVTVKPTRFVYTGGQEDGAEVGLVNYPRFPSRPEEVREKALALAELIIVRCHQLSALVMTPDRTTWLTRRKDFEKEK